MMTRKDYVVTAEILRDAMPYDSDLILKVAEEFAHYFKQDNPRFDRSRFFDAVEENVR